MNSRASKFVSRLLALACVASIPLALYAQDASKSAKKQVEFPPSKWDIFAGYSFLSPHGTFNAYSEGEKVYSASPDDVTLGGILSGAYFFNRYVGVQVEGAYHDYDSNNTVTTAAGGLILRNPMGRWTQFAHALAGGARMHGNGDYIAPYTPNTWSLDVTGGVGVDYEVSRRWAVRLVQADYEFMNPEFGTNNGVYIGKTEIHALRISGGVVFHPGSMGAPAPVTLACAANPAVAYPGDPVTVTATANGLNPKRKAVYSWFGDGVTGNGETATVATGALAPGEYTVKATVRQGSKAWQVADCSATYTVKAFEPPTVSCSASPSTIKPGETSTISANGVSPQNRPLTYSYKAAAGTVSGTGNTAVFSSTGAPMGPVEITCEATDDKGQTATAPTTVTIAVPVTPMPHTQALCSITFTKDAARPTRVDNEAKACLDEVALSLKKDPNAKAVVVGNSDAKEKAKVAEEEKSAKKGGHKWVADPAAGRAVNTKAYLVVDKGIDPSRISVATGTADGQTAENYLVPEGADFSADVAGATPVHEATVKPAMHTHAAHAKHAAKKAAAKKSAKKAAATSEKSK